MRKEVSKGGTELLSNGTICPYCGKPAVVRDYTRACLVCRNCGAVIDENLPDLGPEWRAYTPQQFIERARTGAPETPLLPDKGLPTIIPTVRKDAQGRELSPEKYRLVRKLIKIQKRLKTSSERNLTIALAEITRMGTVLGLPRVVVLEASVMYREAIKRGLAKGRSIEALAAACVYAACRRYKVPRSLEEIAVHAKIDRKVIAKCYRLIIKEVLGKVPSTSAREYIPRLAKTLKLPPEVQREAISIIEKAYEVGITAGKTPIGLAAAALYIASVLLNSKRTQKEIAVAAGVTEVTIRNRYKELLNKLDIVVYV